MSGRTDAPDAEPRDEQSRLGLDGGRGIAAKLGRTVLLVVFAGFFLIFTSLLTLPDWNPWLRGTAELLVEVCWSFWLLALVFVWWSPAPVRRLYLHAERRMLLLAGLLRWAAVGLGIVTAGLLWYLFHVGILPVRGN